MTVPFTNRAQQDPRVFHLALFYGIVQVLRYDTTYFFFFDVFASILSFLERFTVFTSIVNVCGAVVGLVNYLKAYYYMLQGNGIATVL